MTKAGGHLPDDDAVVELLWLVAIINIEDKRARERAARKTVITAMYQDRAASAPLSRGWSMSPPGSSPSTAWR